MITFMQRKTQLTENICLNDKENEKMKMKMKK
jgi:hypothetical protein